MKRTMRLPLALALALGSGHALALGLGQIEVKSGLYEPLDARIPVIAAQPGEADELTVRLASPEDFERVGLDRPATMAANLQFSVERGGPQPVIRVTTDGEVNDPFVSFLIEVDWGRGRLLREFTVLLDPPTMAPATGTAATAPASEATPGSAAQPLAPTDAPAQPAPPRAPTGTGPRITGDSVTVNDGQTLWTIARDARPEGVSINQMMAALLRANPDAFIGGNINRLRSGAILRIPGREELTAVSDAEATALVREQTQSWQSATQPQPAEAADDDAPSRTGAGPRPSQSRLELVPPGDAGAQAGARSGADASGAQGQELRADLARAREDIAARDQQIEELQSRVEELESLQGDRDRMIELKDSQLAALREQLRELQAQQAVQAGEAPVEEPVDETDAQRAAADALAGEDTATDEAAPPTVDTAATAQDEVIAEDGFGDDAVADESLAEPPAPAPAADITPAEPVAAPMPERAAPTPIWRNPWFLGGIGALVVGLLALLAVRRRGRSEPRAPRGYDSGALAASMAAAKGGGTVADADSYAAVADEYEDERTREEALVDAVAEHPEDLAAHLELARYYYEQGDADRFEGAAEAMYAQVYDPSNALWQQVVEMGRELLPDHPLFELPAASGPVVDASYEPEPAAEDDAYVTDYGSERRWEAPSEPVADRPVTDYETTDYGDGDVAPSYGDSEDQAGTPRVEDLEPATLGESSEYVDDAAPRTAAAGADADSYDYAGGSDDAASTKLELARAYLDMGDVEGARGMLEEVVNEGNAGQRAEAKRLLDDIR